MVFDLTGLFENEGGELSFSCEVDLSRVELGGRFPLQRPVHAEGKAVNTAGVVQLRYRIAFWLDTVCDRCLAPVSREMLLKGEQVAVRALSDEEDEDAFLVLPDGQLDLDELVYADVLLALPSKILCSEGCLGLCPVCGADRNRQPCTCVRKVADPRLRALGELLEQ